MGAGGLLLLPGWGAEAALKNTEYSAMDDKQQQGPGGKQGAKQQQEKEQAAAAAADPDAPVEALFGSGEAAVVRGFRLDVLAARLGQGGGGAGMGWGPGVCRGQASWRGPSAATRLNGGGTARARTPTHSASGCRAPPALVVGTQRRIVMIRSNPRVCPHPPIPLLSANSGLTHTATNTRAPPCTLTSTRPRPHAGAPRCGRSC